MNQREILEKLTSLTPWSRPAFREAIRQGDMPGDRICIGQDHIEKAAVIFPELVKRLKETVQVNGEGKAVITVCGGSGVGKSEIASLLSCYLEQGGIGAYTLSGDNYPHRIPRYNDAERLRIFRKFGLKRLIDGGLYTQERCHIIKEYQMADTDADFAHAAGQEWFSGYVNGGICGLREYLGSEAEIDFQELEEIVAAFKRGGDHIYLKRMGREEAELWYERVDFSEISVLVIEWTHGNSDRYKGVDISILLNSTPEETLAHRRARNRDGRTDSPFTMRVLELEQKMLNEQAHKAKIIVSKQGELLSFSEYQSLMKHE